MAKKIQVTKLAVDEREVKVFVSEQQFFTNKNIQAEGRMLADSDQLSFIYILDVEDDYIYVSFPKETWNDLNIALQKSLPLFLQVDEENRVPLIQFHEELQYFISNINENSNYGEKMVEVVSQFFTNENMG
ncbi:hypothetical protein BKP35_13465 [Anaerobacillus arseniciselenatis]|uniref:Uncharacterized protein n=1 Tax=Anaerobacillus arseniciselenatis TaxID=85682 RepID=A0A1S2LC87_9BACI|nr:hypothetical protein [Anaerobacillus arseniciselenatis]OIJ10119.1 hypothetical protein BKP35_13465 [Anaerobacillus arseniciselenatis]